jgi:predicted small lipoprotein YifL
MARCFGSVVAAAARTLGAAAFAMLAACGQKGPLIGVKPAPPPVVSDIAPDAAIAVPAAVPASAPASR